MPESDIVLAKVAIIQRCLKRIQDTTKGDPDSLEDIDREDIFVLNLQRAVQAAIDLASHVVASEGLGLPATIREHFDLLHQSNVISASMAGKMKAMTGFRNIAIHDYRKIDKDILKSILTHNLPDLEQFYMDVIERFDIPGRGRP
ncbi:MAG: DUF86 domain-containing protein [Syntrophales bacterium]|jgi:uncharacterized protein YutE (UPF0331/DUF86 family)|nr:DUF86 domain-containing protein [Syntrophales bacterium]MCK9528591.1 DUF86 domain-containing protein [Syntrophales bacterium]MDX9922772.1 DUF86 domain-containing protein [Syntrophales bacterium]